MLVILNPRKVDKIKNAFNESKKKIVSDHLEQWEVCDKYSIKKQKDLLQNKYNCYLVCFACSSPQYGNILKEKAEEDFAKIKDTDTKTKMKKVTKSEEQKKLDRLYLLEAAIQLEKLANKLADKTLKPDTQGSGSLLEEQLRKLQN